jgi:hypothetical protein
MPLASLDVPLSVIALFTLAPVEWDVILAAGAVLSTTRLIVAAEELLPATSVAFT